MAGLANVGPSFFSKYKTGTFPYILWKKSVVKSLYRRVAVWALYTYNFTKKLHHRRFPEKSPNFRNQLFFVTFSFVLKNQIT